MHNFKDTQGHSGHHGRPKVVVESYVMMTSSDGNIFRVIDPLCGNSPVTGEFPSQRPVTWGLDLFFDLRLNNGGVNNREAGDWIRHRAHYDVIVMWNLNAIWGLLRRGVYWNSHRTRIWRNLVGPKRTKSTTAILSSVQNLKISKN